MMLIEKYLLTSFLFYIISSKNKTAFFKNI